MTPVKSICFQTLIPCNCCKYWSTSVSAKLITWAGKEYSKSWQVSFGRITRLISIESQPKKIVVVVVVVILVVVVVVVHIVVVVIPVLDPRNIPLKFG